MHIEQYRNYCLRKQGATESFPFDQSTLVHKVASKMFALTNIDTFESINLKCDPETALELRGLYPGITPGYHMNKRHWNTVKMDGRIPDAVIYQWIDNSYRLVVSKLSQKNQKWLAQLNHDSSFH